MDQAHDREKCDHGPCQCAATSDTDYCGVYCENAAKAADVAIACSCGHPGCEL
jgi:hypothetical protein